jgi:hypothetical protein
MKSELGDPSHILVLYKYRANIGRFEVYLAYDFLAGDSKTK